MKKTTLFIILGALFSISLETYGQRVIAEASIVYDITGEGLNGATTTVYIKGNNCRSDMVSPLGRETTIYNSKTNEAVILKEFSGQKLMITLTQPDWIEKNKASSDVSFVLTSEYKTIGTYKTRKAIAKMADGKTFQVYYAPDLVPANKEYDATFNQLPGLPIEYEIESGSMKFRYSLSSINYDPVKVSLFDFPTSGYRVMTYSENQKLKKGN